MKSTPHGYHDQNIGKKQHQAKHTRSKGSLSSRIDPIGRDRVISLYRKGRKGPPPEDGAEAEQSGPDRAAYVLPERDENGGPTQRRLSSAGTLRDGAWAVLDCSASSGYGSRSWESLEFSAEGDRICWLSGRSLSAFTCESGRQTFSHFTQGKSVAFLS